MRYNDVKFCAALAIACAGSVPAWAADPTFVGDWNVTFFLEPNRAVGATQCIVVTSVPGTVAGVPTSGHVEFADVCRLARPMDRAW